MANTSPASALPLPYFNVAQTFYVQGIVSQSQTAIPDSLAISSVSINFKYKPAPTGSSGITNPGVTVYLAPTTQGYPNITPDILNNYARCTYQQIVTSSDGSVATNFLFNTPVQVQAGQLYAILLSYDGNDTFVPWTAAIGDWIVGTTNYFSTAFSPLIGSFYEYVDLTGGQGGLPVTGTNPSTIWNPVAATALTFQVFVAQYAVNGTPATFANLVDQVYSNGLIQEWNANTNTLTWIFPQNQVEGIAFNLAQSTVQNYIGAQRAYQNTISYPGGFVNGAINQATVSAVQGNTLVTASNSYPNGVAFNWNNIYTTTAGQNFIVFQDSSGVDIRKVMSVVSNTVIQVDEPITFTNSAATFMVTPTATVSSTLSSSPYGQVDNFLFLTQSTANASVRFVNNTIMTANVLAGGSGYNNSDVLYVFGYEIVPNKVVGGYPAVANIVTTGSGAIANIYFSNVGAGFVFPNNIITVISNSSIVPTGNSSANTSNGSAANIAYTVGSTVMTEMTNNIFQNTVVTNINLDYVVPYCNVSNPYGTSYDLELETQYYMEVDNTVSSGYAWYVQQPAQVFDMQLSTNNPLTTNNPVAFISYSNEFITPYANGAQNDQVNALSGFSNGIVLMFNNQMVNPLANIQSDYQSVIISTQPTMEFGHYIINNSYYNEYTNSGNSWAKHVTTIIPFNSFAEDLRLYLTVYKPQYTDFKAFAKIQNSNDTEAFASEDWTELTLVSGANLVSSTSDRTDLVELVYGFKPWQNSNNHLLGANALFTFGNTVTTYGTSTVANATVTTTGGFQGVANIQPGTVVRIYQPYFSNADYGVFEVSSITNDTTLILNQGISANVNFGGNPAICGSGLSMDIIGYPHQAFNNILNANTVRYFNQSGAAFDGYNTVQLKICLLSSEFSYVPELNSIRLLGLSA